MPRRSALSASPRVLRREVPRGLAAVVLRLSPRRFLGIVALIVAGIGVGNGVASYLDGARRLTARKAATASGRANCSPTNCATR